MSLNMYPCYDKYDKYKKWFMEMVLVRYSIMFAEIFLSIKKFKSFQC